ncbi:MAG: hydrogenase maturation protease [Candidatus Eisenbacteria bacterium]|nr:hydrogenase maturation protease [Candidatus Eisenbacteria bacterium]
MKIEIESLARVEGHGGILVEMEGNKIKDVLFNVFEGPRLIESLTVGKTPAEDVSLVCRICAICTLSHRYSALRAMERALGITVPPKTHLTRTLMHFGEMIESHSLHIFFLSLPDLVNRPSAIALLDDFKNEVALALKIKKFGNLIMATTADRMIHGENPIIGGFGRFPSKQQLTEIKNLAEELLPQAVKAADLVGSFSLPDFFESDTLYVACNPEDGKFGFVGDTVLLSSKEELSIEDYKKLTNERVVPHSFAKRSLYKGKPFSVGSLARVNLLGERLTGEAAKCFKKYYGPRWKTNPLFNIMAQAIEMVYCIEEIPALIDKIIPLADPPVVSATRSDGEATGAVEAPRGTLYHHYRIKDGRVAEADIITPTAQNLDDIERYFRLAVENLPSDFNNDPTTILETIARAYDPCLSCSAHLVEVKRTERPNWKLNLSSAFGGAESEKPARPIFVGLGNVDRADDGLGIVIARRLKSLGCQRAVAEDEWQKFLSHLAEIGEGPVVFIDAADFGAEPGQVGLFPLSSVKSNHVTTHKALFDFYRQILECDSSRRRGDKEDGGAANSGHYLLAIQPSSTEFSSEMSAVVSRAVEQVTQFLSDFV